MGSRHSMLNLRSKPPYSTGSRLLRACFWSQAYGRPSREHWSRCLSCGPPSRDTETRGFTFCSEPSARRWRSSDLAPGRWMPGYLDGSASTFQTERVGLRTPFEGISQLKESCRASRYDGQNLSI